MCVRKLPIKSSIHISWNLNFFKDIRSSRHSFRILLQFLILFWQFVKNQFAEKSHLCMLKDLKMFALIPLRRLRCNPMEKWSCSIYIVNCDNLFPDYLFHNSSEYRSPQKWKCNLLFANLFSSDVYAFSCWVHTRKNVD